VNRILPQLDKQRIDEPACHDKRRDAECNAAERDQRTPAISQQAAQGKRRGAVHLVVLSAI
jgi:hypothetical protein